MHIHVYIFIERENLIVLESLKVLAKVTQMSDVAQGSLLIFFFLFALNVTNLIHLQVNVFVSVSV
jgi:hypothetical protein